MGTNKAKKNKKPLRTTLGKAPNHNEAVDDISQVLKPIETSVYGIRQVLAIFQKGTDEVKNYLTFECDILFECRICRSIFRSLANLVLHKRTYCPHKFHSAECFKDDDDKDNSSTVYDKDKSCQDSGLTSVIEKLKEKQHIKELSANILKQDLSNENYDTEKNSTKMSEHDILLEKIATNNAAVFQTVLGNFSQKSMLRPDMMKSEVMEIHGILDKNEAILDENGKITEFKNNKESLIQKNDLFCSECNLKFSTKKTLTYHLKYKHNNSRLVYICPECKDSFANAWSVFRHLLRVHRKTNSQVKRMRQQIHNSVVRRDEEPCKKKQLPKQEDKVTDDENQWLDNVESDKDFQMCGGCGKRFERKAALQSHVQMCTKRIVVCNTIKENNAKKRDEECKDLKTKGDSNEKDSHLQKRAGAAKRKPYSLRTYKPEINFQEIAIIVEKMNTNNNDDIESNFDFGIIPNTKSSENAAVEKDDLKEDSSSISPTMENIDTEKMLNIIGISENQLKISQLTKGLDIIIDDNIGKIIEMNSESKQEETSRLDDVVDLNVENFTENKGTDIVVGNSNDTSNYISESDVPESRPLKRKRELYCKESNKDIKISEDFEGDSDIELTQKAESFMNRDQLECLSCRMNYRTLNELLSHMSLHFSWFRFQCSRCSFISWSRSACNDHARQSHNIEEDNMNSVVLQIPNWKIGLMTHNFRDLTDDANLSGSYTDEVLVESTESSTTSVPDQNDRNSVEDKDDLLFSGNEIESVSPDHVTNSNPLTDSIDIDNNDDDDAYLVELPEEIVTYDDTNIELCLRCKSETPVLIQEDEFIPLMDCKIKEENEMWDTDLDTFNEENMLPNCSNSDLDNMDTVVKVKSESIEITECSETTKSDEEIHADCTPSTSDNLNKNIECLPLVRSTRNRIPSIRTSQVDFLYNLNGVIKMNNSTMNSKPRKMVNGNQKNNRESNSKPMKVYSKK